MPFSLLTAQCVSHRLCLVWTSWNTGQFLGLPGSVDCHHDGRRVEFILRWPLTICCIVAVVIHSSPSEFGFLYPAPSHVSKLQSQTPLAIHVSRLAEILHLLPQPWDHIGNCDTESPCTLDWNKREKERKNERTCACKRGRENVNADWQNYFYLWQACQLTRKTDAGPSWVQAVLPFLTAKPWWLKATSVRRVRTRNYSYTH